MSFSLHRERVHCLASFPVCKYHRFGLGLGLQTPSQSYISPETQQSTLSSEMPARPCININWVYLTARIWLFIAFYLSQMQLFSISWYWNHLSTIPRSAGKPWFHRKTAAGKADLLMTMHWGTWKRAEDIKFLIFKSNLTSVWHDLGG